MGLDQYFYKTKRERIQEHHMNYFLHELVNENRQFGDVENCEHVRLDSSNISQMLESAYDYLETVDEIEALLKKAKQEDGFYSWPAENSTIEWTDEEKTVYECHKDMLAHYSYALCYAWYTGDVRRTVTSLEELLKEVTEMEEDGDLTLEYMAWW